MMSVSLHESAAVFGPQPPLGEDESMLTPVCSDPVVQGRSRVDEHAMTPCDMRRDSIERDRTKV